MPGFLLALSVIVRIYSKCVAKPIAVNTKTKTHVFKNILPIITATPIKAVTIRKTKLFILVNYN